MNRVLHRFLAMGAVVVLTACTSPSSSGAAPIGAPSGGDATHPWVMDQTADGDPTAGGAIQPLYGALGGKTSTASGTKTRVLTATTPRPRGEVFGFAFGNSSLADPTYGYPAWSMNLLTTIAYFGLSLAWDGTIVKSGSSWTTWNSSQLTGLVSTAHANGVRVILSVNLHDFSTSPTSSICSALYPKRRATTISQIVAQVNKMGVDGVNLDYEGTNTTCQYNYTLQSAITSLAKEFRAKLPKAYIAVDTYSGSAGDSTGFFNIPALAPYVDSFFVMAYDMEYSNWYHLPLNCSSFCLGPTAPLTSYHYNLTKSMAQYTAAVPASKVILGVPYYGRKECVTGVTPTTAPPHAMPAAGTTSDGFIDASAEAGYGLNSNYRVHRDANDTAGSERWDTFYSSDAKCTRELYWDDTVSLGHKYDLVNKLSLRGVGIFALQYGGGTPALWDLLQTKFVGCLGSTLAAYPSAPEPPGAVVRFTATATGCTNPHYEFWVQYPDGKWVMKQAFGGNTWYWRTTGLRAGTYTLHVWANQVGNPTKRGEAISDVTYKIAVMPDCASASLAPPAATQAAGTSIAFTASSTVCGTPSYEYRVRYPTGKWYVKQAFSVAPTWTWSTAGLRPGTYKVRVYANQFGHSTAHPEAIASSAVSLTGCTSATLGPPTASQPAGSTVAFTATSAGCANPEYEYWVQFPGGTWYMKRGFSTDATWTWNTVGLSPGTYTVHAWATQQGAYTGAFEVFGSSKVTLTGCTSVTLAPASASSKVGAAVVFTAAATGCPNPAYELWLKDTRGKWHLLRGFSTSATWTWNTAGWGKGVYHVVAWANQQGAFTGTAETYTSTTHTLT